MTTRPNTLFACMKEEGWVKASGELLNVWAIFLLQATALLTLWGVCTSEMVQRWCTLEGGFLSYYESEQMPTAMGRMDLAEIVTLAVCRLDTPPRVR